MKNFKIALQLYSVRDAMAEDFEGTLRKVKEMGYDGVEFAGLYEKSAEEIKTICEKVGLVPISAHVSFRLLRENPDLMKVYRDIGCKFIAFPSIRNEYEPGAEKFGETKDYVNKFGKMAKDMGMTLCYHNHDFEFGKINGEYKLDILYKECPPDVLQTELDLCWVRVGGEDPAEYLRKYAGRAQIVHFKDYIGDKNANMYELIDEKLEKVEEDVTPFEYRPVGYGVQDVKSLLAAAEDAGCEWIVVEQDKPSMDKTPLECVNMSVDYLKSLINA